MPLLLNPGPVNLSERVRQALAKPDLCHREPEFAQLQQAIRQKLLAVYELAAADWAAVLLTGSGTATIEAMLLSLAPEKAPILIIENGVYGERLGKIAAIHGLAHQRLCHEWGEAIDLDRLAEKLSHKIAYVALVHHETTTGRRNDVAAVSAICRRFDTPLLVDAVSSFGAEALQFADWNIAACAGTANKCLHGVPGTSFVIVRRAALKKPAAPRSLYLDLHTYLCQQDAGGTPFTQSVQGFYALDAALDEHAETGGWQARREYYREKMAIARAGLAELGIRPLLDEADSSCVLSAFHLPAGMDYQSLHDELKQRGFIIYAGQGALAKSLFRISPMGTVSGRDMRTLVAAVGEIMAAAI